MTGRQIAAAVVAPAALLGLFAVIDAAAATTPRISAAAGFPINATADTAPAMRRAITTGIRRYSTTKRARVTSVTRARRGTWHAVTTAGAPYRVLLCTRRYCTTSAPPTQPVITIEVRR